MDPPDEIIITRSNLADWPSYLTLFEAGKIIADKTGRMRYPHGAPVGKMILMRIDKDGTPRYCESASEWFDPDSLRAKQFVWPES
ncbi:MAG: hypothetical protein KF873_00725 [Gemmataceae bacterium]|nr:hypothetical protein [Gemmataceae bacterium]